MLRCLLVGSEAMFTYLKMAEESDKFKLKMIRGLEDGLLHFMKILVFEARRTRASMEWATFCRNGLQATT